MNLEKLSSKTITELNSWLKTQYNINLEEHLTSLEELETLETFLNLIKFDKKLKLKTLENNKELTNKLVIENAKLEEKLNILNLDITEKPELNNLITELSVLLNNFNLLELNSSK
ncbi:hypothetical protein CONCODRAFT_4863 [Conidiobolus coronatus NRRL 28638]|uniref:Uncharacterized protein n=1 Tax=Conidiobolus coronatus (strain ATCC 28846 / CBS 209.66 / NRRL 28638) TaxID=796925 RepID=A0A137PBG6_CONC2|nr:hypothetical protein CONCODRAFT_4863 [Conidiobolus coronatus NRRL 28638]|eukprot:KXN72324.1 hypothetical protein CONCODRAFT_4863 [Conidiobolus coronatus NRRL 28638]